MTIFRIVRVRGDDHGLTVQTQRSASLTMPIGYVERNYRNVSYSSACRLDSLLNDDNFHCVSVDKWGVLAVFDMTK